MATSKLHGTFTDSFWPSHCSRRIPYGEDQSAKCSLRYNILTMEKGSPSPLASPVQDGLLLPSAWHDTPPTPPQQNDQGGLRESRFASLVPRALSLLPARIQTWSRHMASMIPTASTSCISHSRYGTEYIRYPLNLGSKTAEAVQTSSSASTNLSLQKLRPTCMGH